MATQLLGALSRAGASVDCFLSVPHDRVPAAVSSLPGLRVVARPSSWQYNRWYSSHSMSKTITGLGARAAGQFGLAEEIARRHKESPYDVVYQFSHIETIALARVRRKLPPVLVHPEVHMAGELRWHTRERALSRRCESRKAWLAAQALLRMRSRAQQHDVRSICGWISPSRIFADLIAHDYGVPIERFSVVPNPIDLERFAPEQRDREEGPVRLLFVSRMSVRKGVEIFVELSHRLSDLAGRLVMEAVGGPSLWSNYVPLLTDLHRGVASYCGPVAGASMPAMMRRADVLLQPSHYEPFALTVGEAVASGTPVIVSNAVGAGEFLSSSCCLRVTSGDTAEFERAIRAVVDEVETARGRPRNTARSEAQRLFGLDVVGPQLIDSIRRFT